MRVHGLDSMYTNLVEEVKKLDSNKFYEVNAYLTQFEEIGVHETLDETDNLREALAYILEG